MRNLCRSQLSACGAKITGNKNNFAANVFTFRKGRLGKRAGRKGDGVEGLKDKRTTRRPHGVCVYTQKPSKWRNERRFRLFWHVAVLAVQDFHSSCLSSLGSFFGSKVMDYSKRVPAGRHVRRKANRHGPWLYYTGQKRNITRKIKAKLLTTEQNRIKRIEERVCM